MSMFCTPLRTKELLLVHCRPCESVRAWETNDLDDCLGLNRCSVNHVHSSAQLGSGAAASEPVGGDVVWPSYVNCHPTDGPTRQPGTDN